MGTFPTQLTEVQLGNFDEVPLEVDADINREDLIRKVVVTKARDEEWGFSIRGGQRKLSKNDVYMQITTITPILITQIVSGKAADRCGLRVGDKLLGINHYSLK